MGRRGGQRSGTGRDAPAAFPLQRGGGGQIRPSSRSLATDHVRRRPVLDSRRLVHEPAAALPRAGREPHEPERPAAVMHHRAREREELRVADAVRRALVAVLRHRHVRPERRINPPGGRLELRPVGEAPRERVDHLVHDDVAELGVRSRPS